VANQPISRKETADERESCATTFSGPNPSKCKRRGFEVPALLFWHGRNRTFPAIRPPWGRSARSAPMPMVATRSGHSCRSVNSGAHAIEPIVGQFEKALFQFWIVTAPGNLYQTGCLSAFERIRFPFHGHPLLDDHEIGQSFSTVLALCKGECQNRPARGEDQN
jgi:hypothetical protein